MIDISDGLISDLGHILKASKKGALLFEECLPISSKARSLNDALYTGEDFELLFSVGKRCADNLKKQWPFKKVKLTCIGQVTAKGTGLRIKDRQGNFKKAEGSGWRHF